LLRFNSILQARNLDCAEKKTFEASHIIKAMSTEYSARFSQLMLPCPAGHEHSLLVSLFFIYFPRLLSGP
jgi:hypothetical protein